MIIISFVLVSHESHRTLSAHLLEGIPQIPRLISRRVRTLPTPLDHQLHLLQSLRNIYLIRCRSSDQSPHIRCTRGILAEIDRLIKDPARRIPIHQYRAWVIIVRRSTTPLEPILNLRTPFRLGQLVLFIIRAFLLLLVFLLAIVILILCALLFHKARLQLCFRSGYRDFLAEDFLQLRQIMQDVGSDVGGLGGLFGSGEDEVQLTRISEDDLLTVAAEETEEWASPSFVCGKRELQGSAWSRDLSEQ